MAQLNIFSHVLGMGDSPLAEWTRTIKQESFEITKECISVNLKKIRLFAAVAGITSAMWLTATAADKVPTAVADKVIESDLAYLKKQLEKEPEKRAIPTIKATAIMLAAVADEGIKGPNADKMASLRAGALEIAEAVAKKDFAAAKTALTNVKTAKGDKKEIDLSKQAKINLDEVMSTFRKGTVGGRNIEADIKDQIKNLKDNNIAARVGAHTSVLGTLTEKLPPPNTTGDKLKAWQDISKQMKQAGLDLAEEASKSDADKKKVVSALMKLEKTCVDCHKIFRE
jgi:hypothetical protein